MRDLSLAFAILVAVTLVAIVAIAAFYYLSSGPGAKCRYLVAPYLDLDEPGERGSYYALTSAR